jgi:hypothetical protein
MTMSPRELYFVSWWFDGLVVGGLSILTYATIALLYYNGDATPVVAIAIALSFFINYPHFSATVYRLYQNREHLRQFPVTAWGLPPLLLGTVAASCWQPQTIAPYFLMLYLVWSPYHYSGQTIGITMIYARRAGFPIRRWERLALSAFVFSAFVCGFCSMEQQGATEFYGMSIPAIALPGWAYAGAQALMWTGAAVFLAFVITWCIKQRRVLPPIMFVPAIAHFVWFVPGASVKTFLVIVPLFHSLQYLMVALAMQLKLRIDGVGNDHSWSRIRAEACRWFLRNIAGGVLLFVGVPALLIWVPLPLITIAGFVAAAVNIHHFFVDGVIWKLRDAASSAALMMNISELSRAPVIDGQFSRAEGV